MWRTNFSVYLGEENDNDFLGFIVENNLFMIVDIIEFDKEKGRQLVKEIINGIINQEINSLAVFEELLSLKINQANLPLGFSLAAGYLTDSKLYLKTYNDGEVHIKRDRQLAKIISVNKSASGFIKENDLLIFSTKNFNDDLGGIEKIKKFTQSAKPHEIVETLTPELKAGQDSKAIALLINFQKDTVEEVVDNKKSIFSKIKEDFFRLNNYPENYKKKKYTLVFVVVILLVLVWSVGFSYQRRQEAMWQKKITAAKEAVQKKLKEADETAFLDLAQALSLVNEARIEADKLEKNTPKKHQGDVNKIKQLISSEESKLLKKEEKNYEEYYDLAFESKDIEGIKLYLDANLLAILDNKKGVVYSLALDKKSLDKKISSDFKSAKIIARYQNEISSFVPGEGIIKFADGKSKKVIENDKEWGEVIDIKIYNGNIYLLDKGKDQIYKYLVAEGGYSQKQSYFVSGNAIDLSDATSMAIDSAVYIGFSNYVAKYISGVRDEFKTNFPDDKLSLTKVITNKELEKVYVWDKNHEVIYVLAKNGSYEKQIKSSIISKAVDIVVFENSAYLLVGQKIYKIDLD